MLKVKISQLRDQILLFVRLLCVLASIVMCVVSQGAAHQVHFFPNGSDPVTGTGVLRIINHSSETGSVSVVAIDDAGTRSESTTFQVAAEGITTLRSADLENGNSSLDLTGIGSGQGPWRLELTTDLNLEILSYVIGTNGQVSPMQIPVFGNNGRFQFSFSDPPDTSIEYFLRIINRSMDADVFVTVRGTDDTGQEHGPVVVVVNPDSARQIAVNDLESGSEEFTGSLGSGSEGWTLEITADGPIHLITYAQDVDDAVTNLSISPRVVKEPVNLTEGEFTRVYVDNATFRNGENSIAFSRDGTFTETYEGIEYEENYAILDVHRNTVVMLLEYRGMDSCLTQIIFADSTTASRSVNCLVMRERYLEHDVVVDFEDDAKTLVPSPISELQHLVVAADSVSFGSDIDVSECISVVDYDYGGVRYTITNSRWQSRTSDDMPWTYVDDSWRTEEICVAEPTEDGTYRMLVQVEIDGGNQYFLSNIVELTAPEPPAPTAAQLFSDNISESIVQMRCINCHTTSGVASSARLIFVTSSTDGHEASNLEEFEDFFDVVTNARTYILNKVSAQVSHGGGAQLPTGTDRYRHMDEFLQAVEREHSE